MQRRFLGLRTLAPPPASTLTIRTTGCTPAHTTAAIAIAAMCERVATATIYAPGGRVAPATPPPLRKLPPAPPLPGRGAVAEAGALTFKSPNEVLTLMIEYVPTFFVPMHAVASIMPDDVREVVKARGKAVMFFRRYRFFFDLNVVEGSKYEVRLREDVQHPRRGAADTKFSLADIGESASYSVVPEFVTSLESIDSRADVNVNVTPHLPPPSLQVRLQERVPVLERLRAMVPADDFAMVDELAERVPEDILTHPYFDVQGGLAAIASKFPDMFQVVDGQIRQRPAHLAPLALDDFTFETSPEPEVIAIVKAAVCASDIPAWVSVTGLYEQLALEQRRGIKRGYKSFASFLRAHGSCLALSNDLLRVSHWIPPRRKPSKAAAATAAGGGGDTDGPDAAAALGGGGGDDAPGTVQYTHLHVLNELYDRFPRGKELTLHEFMATVPEHLRASVPRNMAAWLAQYPQYFVVEGAAATRDPSDVRVRRARDHAPIDIALQLYPHIPEEGVSVVTLAQQLPPALRAHVDQFGIHNIVETLSEWLELLDGDLFRRKSMDELEAALQRGGASDEEPPAA